MSLPMIWCGALWLVSFIVIGPVCGCVTVVLVCRFRVCYELLLNLRVYTSSSFGVPPSGGWV